MVRPVITRQRSSTNNNLTQTSITSFFQSRNNSNNNRSNASQSSLKLKKIKKRKCVIVPSSPIVIDDDEENEHPKFCSGTSYPIQYEIDNVDFDFSQESLNGALTIKQENMMVVNYGKRKDIPNLSQSSENDSQNVDSPKNHSGPVTSTPLKKNDSNETINFESLSQDEEDIPSSSDTIPFDFEKDLTIQITPTKNPTKANILSNIVVSPATKKPAEEEETELPRTPKKKTNTTSNKENTPSDSKHSKETIVSSSLNSSKESAIKKSPQATKRPVEEDEEEPETPKKKINLTSSKETVPSGSKHSKETIVSISSNSSKESATKRPAEEDEEETPKKKTNLTSSKETVPSGSKHSKETIVSISSNSSKESATKRPAEEDEEETPKKKTNLTSSKETVPSGSKHSKETIVSISSNSSKESATKRPAEEDEEETPKKKTNLTSSKETTPSGSKHSTESIVSDTSSASNISKESPIKKSPRGGSRRKLTFKKEEDEDGQLNMYYMKEFSEMIKFVVNGKTTAFLYSPVEKNILRSVCEMCVEYQYFCFKLYMYLPKWYNIYTYCNKINLKLADENVNALYNFLKRHEIIDYDYTKVQLPDLLKEVPAKDMKEICKSLKINLKNIKQNKKEDIAALLLKTANTQATLSGLQSFPDRIILMIKKKLGYCVRLKKEVRDVLNKVYIMCTFCNSDLAKPQDYFRFKSNAANVLPTYEIENNFTVFYSKCTFDRFLEAKLLTNLMVDALDLQAKHKDRRFHNLVEIGRKAYNHLREETGSNEHSLYKQFPHLKHFTAQSMYIAVLTKCALHITSKYHEEVKIWLEFLIEQNFLYESKKCGIWYNQLALIYMHYLNDYESAAKVVLSGFEEKENMSDIVLEELGIRGRRIKDSKTHTISNLYHDEIVAKGPEPPDKDPFPEVRIDAKTILKREQGLRKLYVVHKQNGDKEFLNVENVALNYYKENGFNKGFHCEGIILNGLFVLYFYDIIYDSSVKGVFISKLQTYPLDMYSPYFYENRKNAIDKRLNSLLEWSDVELNNFAINCFESHNHENPLMSFQAIVQDRQTLMEIIFCIGNKLLVKIFKRFLSNFRNYRSGLPDLFVYSSEMRKCKFVEVKSNNDKLSTKQKFWLKCLRDFGADIEVCHVHAMGNKKKLLKGEKVKKRTRIATK